MGPGAGAVGTSVAGRGPGAGAPKRAGIADGPGVGGRIEILILDDITLKYIFTQRH